MLIANFIGILIFLYLLWKRLKDDYHSEKIFNYGFLVLVGQFIAILFSKFLIAEQWFWPSLLITVIICFVVTKRQKMKLFEVLDATVIGLLPWLGLIYLTNSIFALSLSSFLVFWIILICVFAYFYLNSVYRSFSWYRSGRVGFSGVIVVVLFFILRTLISVFFPDTKYFANYLEIYFSGSTALLFTILLYNLSRKSD